MNGPIENYIEIVGKMFGKTFGAVMFVVLYVVFCLLPATDSRCCPTSSSDSSSDEENRDCVSCIECNKKLLPGQFLCTNKDIDPDTQQPRGCSREGKVKHFGFINY